MERIESKYIFGSLLVNLESIMDFTKKMSSLLSLLASIVFNDLFGLKNCIIGLLNEI